MVSDPVTDQTAVDVTVIRIDRLPDLPKGLLHALDADEIVERGIIYVFEGVPLGKPNPQPWVLRFVQLEPKE